MDGWSVTQDDCLQRQIAKKFFKLKIEACSVNAGPLLVTTQLSNIIFHLQPIWLQTLIAIDSESRLTLFPSFCAQPSEVAVLFYSNLTRSPFLRQVINLGLLLCTGFDSEHAVLFVCLDIFTQRPMIDRKIEQSHGLCFGQQQLLANSIKNFISHEKKVTCSCPNFTKH